MHIQSVRRSAAVLVAAIVATAAAARVASAQDHFKSLVSFDGTDGDQPPFAQLVQGTDGDVYGTTNGFGGRYDRGTVFKITPSGALTTLYNFCPHSGCPDGAYPAGLILASNGNYYGITNYGGAHGEGTVFKITPRGALTTLYSFCSQGGASCMDGAVPTNGVAEGFDGNFYGVTVEGGGSTACSSGCGTVFKITPDGALSTLHRFDSTDGSGTVGVIQGTDGDFYGTNLSGGTGNSCSGGCGTVFKISPSGALTTLHNFGSTMDDGASPFAPPFQGADGNFYGTTQSGGVNGEGIFFQITPGGTLTTLYDFGVGTNGYSPAAPVIQATDGNFYGTTQSGGENGQGTIFRITPDGALTALYSFCSQTGCADGTKPHAGLMQHTSGVFYGAAPGGAYGDGTVYSLAVGLGPFVETLPTAGKAGDQVRILGTYLTGATSVTFNGTPATLTRLTRTEIQTTVPSGATTGPVQVVTSGGTLTSNVPFRVIQ